MKLTPQNALFFISVAIDLRDNHHSMEIEQIESSVKKLAESGFMSARQISRICGNRISHSKITNIIDKRTKIGGKVNPVHLEDLRKIIFAKSEENVDYKIVKGLVSNGTSQAMVARITGLAQSTISRKTSDGRKLIQLQG
jgi:predicted transcriptional regulator